MTKKPETVNREDLIRRKDGLIYKKYAMVPPFTGVIEEFHSNGQLRFRGNYKNGQQEGLHESFYDNGQLRYGENYKNGQSEGLWEWLNYNGQLKSRENYKNGQPEGHWEHFNSGVNRFLNETIEF